MTPTMIMEWSDVRRQIVIALFTDDVLFEKLVLKGGNALNLVHQIGTRTSLDVDLSLDGDFDDIGDAKNRLVRSLRKQFLTVGYTVFDETLEPRPRRNSRAGEKWGGYELRFKLMPTDRFRLLEGDIERARREAETIGPDQQRVLRVEMSKHEYCAGKQEMEIDDYTICVYTLPMIAIEKVRAICQQMPEYMHRANKIPRARDFYDIHAIIMDGGVDLATSENLDLFRGIFAAKEVPLNLIKKIPEYRAYHSEDWPAVEQSVSGKLESFNFYFDFLVREQIPRLESLWIV